MRIGIDCSPIYDDAGHIKAGIGYYAYNLVQHLLKIDTTNEYVLFFNKVRANNCFLNSKQVTCVEWPLYSYRKFLPFFYSHVLKAVMIFKQHLNVMHFTAHTIPLFSWQKKVLTIHDLAILHNPNWFVRRPFYRKFLLPHSIKKANHIIAVSQTTKEDIIRFTKSVPEKISVVYEGISPVPNEYVDSKYVDDNYLLFIGTVEPRKNISHIIQAFEQIMNDEKIKAAWPNLELYLAGRRGWKCNDIYRRAEQSEFKEKIKMLGLVSDKDKEKLLRQALVLVYPSWYEGFGLPILEGFSRGVPVITSNIGAMQEIAQDCACVVDPANVYQIADAMKKLLLDEKKRQYYQECGKKRVKDFSWQAAAQKTLDIYKEYI